MLYTGRAVSGDGAGRCQVGERRRAERGVPWPSAIQQNFLGRSLNFKTPFFSKHHFFLVWSAYVGISIIKSFPSPPTCHPLSSTHLVIGVEDVEGVKAWRRWSSSVVVL